MSSQSLYSQEEGRPNTGDKLLEDTESTIRALKMSTGWSVMASEYNYVATSNLPERDLAGILRSRNWSKEKCRKWCLHHYDCTVTAVVGQMERDEMKK